MRINCGLIFILNNRIKKHIVRKLNACICGFGDLHNLLPIEYFPKNDSMFELVWLWVDIAQILVVHSQKQSPILTSSRTSSVMNQLIIRQRGNDTHVELPAAKNRVSHVDDFS
jgi:hypothetical protein